MTNVTDITNQLRSMMMMIRQAVRRWLLGSSLWQAWHSNTESVADRRLLFGSVLPRCYVPIQLPDQENMFGLMLPKLISFYILQVVSVSLRTSRPDCVFAWLLNSPQMLTTAVQILQSWVLPSWYVTISHFHHCTIVNCTGLHSSSQKWLFLCYIC